MECRLLLRLAYYAQPMDTIILNPLVVAALATLHACLDPSTLAPFAFIRIMEYGIYLSLDFPAFTLSERNLVLRREDSLSHTLSGPALKAC